MVQRQQLYTAFGQLIYTLAKADGEIQREEFERINKLLVAHQWSNDILWSFNEECSKKEHSKKVLSKVLGIFREYGPYYEYPYFFHVVEEVAEAFGGIVKEEQEILDELRKVLLIELKA